MRREQQSDVLKQCIVIEHVCAQPFPKQLRSDAFRDYCSEGLWGARFSSGQQRNPSLKPSAVSQFQPKSYCVILGHDTNQPLPYDLHYLHAHHRRPRTGIRLPPALRCVCIHWHGAGEVTAEHCRLVRRRFLVVWQQGESLEVLHDNWNTLQRSLHALLPSVRG